MRETVEVRQDGDGITWLVMNRPDKRNAMNPTMHREMLAALDELETDDQTSVVVLTGAGTAFSAGQDLNEFFRCLDDNPKERLEVRRVSQRWMFERLYRYPKPTIAMVNGWCCGGGFTPLFACDLAVAAASARFSVSEVNWGMIPGGYVAKVLSEVLTYRDALFYLLTGDVFDGRQAARMGLVNFAVPAEELEAATRQLAAKLLAKNQATLYYGKLAYKLVRHMDWMQADDYLEAKEAELLHKDPRRGAGQGIEKFLDSKSYKPALAPFPD